MITRPSRLCSGNEKSCLVRLLALAVLLLARAIGPAGAASLPSDPNELGQVRLIAATTAVGELASLRLGLEFQLAPGWKTYWRTPGDAGYAPRLDWSGSENLAEVLLKWPLPERFSLFGLETLGYEGTPVLPVIATLREPGRKLDLTLKLDWLVCKEVCIPMTSSLALVLPAGPAKASAEAHEIDRFNARVPSPATAVGLALDRIEAAGEGNATRLTILARADPAFIHPDVLIEGPSGFGFGRPQVRLSDSGRQARFTLSASGPDAASLAGQRLMLTLVDGERALEVQHLAEAPVRSSLALVPMLLIALLGGLVLNLMPCVLPVLSLKLLQLARHSGAERSATRLAFLASAAGIVASFLLLALGAILLKRWGMAVGWGMQFQEPAFLVFMTGVLAFFAASLTGLVQLRLPSALAEPAARPHGQGLAAHFLTGVFATLLATPCSAPFVGTALGFALSQGPAEIATVFLAMGLGLAFPYLGLSLFPGLVTKLPRPGPWMIWLERVLAAALTVTALWLTSVLASESGIVAALVVLGLIAAALAAWVIVPGRPAIVAASVLALAAFFAPGHLGPGGAAPVAVASDSRWRAFDRESLRRLVGEGKVVLVDVTADWCLTCQVNKRIVLSSEAVRQKLDQKGVVALRADWTRPDAEIADYLASHGRYGIPFNAVYGPGAPDGVLLPELLSEAAVIAAFERAGEPKVAANKT
ncbi:MAG: thioredoxin family protein [Proteobacteria bacterium]|nr:thioredoxin family protein [Pseudomonadota bacterium]MBI3496538.1 thioredoxin family protein [Pseudomonadota bacterium]